MKETKVKRTYLYAVGRRKTAVARVRYYSKGDGSVQVNEKDYKAYFDVPGLGAHAIEPLKRANLDTSGSITIKVAGGGKHAQADAVRLGIARVLLEVNPELRQTLKRASMLTRDPRRKERKKPGLKRARRAPQWSKR